MMYVKVVNVGEGQAPGSIRLKNCAVDTSVEKPVEVIRLASAKGTDENTLDTPNAISPQAATLKPAQPSLIEFDVPAFSVNIVKIRLK